MRKFAERTLNDVALDKFFTEQVLKNASGSGGATMLRLMQPLL